MNNKGASNLIFVIIVLIGVFLRFDRIDTLMMFMGDQGWFYISARDMVLNGNIPLVGITSSHTWLHQGPLWTYMLAGALFVSNFNPVSGAILTSAIGVGTVFLIYKIGNDFFSKELGLLAALLYAASPLVIIHARMSYHTSPIPFLAGLLIYSFIKTVKGNANWFPISLLSIALLYNFELATVVFIPVVLFFLAYGFYNKNKWVVFLKTPKIIFLSLIALIVPMLPILVYDFSHGFPQTLKFGAWFFYKGFQMIGFFEKSSSESVFSAVEFFVNKISLLIFAPSVLISTIILATATTFSAIYIRTRKNIFLPVSIIFGLTVLGLVGFFAAGVRSEAYLPMLFPGIILLMAFAIRSIFKKNKYAVLIIIVISFTNAVFIVKNNYFMDRPAGYGPSLERRIEAVESIVEQADGQKYNIEGRGKGSEFESFKMNYEYLSWRLGNPPSREKQELVFIIEEKDARINVKIK